MPNTRSAAKRVRQNEKRRLRNRMHKGRARSFVKKALKLIDQGNLEAAEDMVHQAISALDRAWERGVLHKNTVARKKSRLMKRLNEAKRSSEA
ncbi:MAG: 30S ribosomal protein S20 [Chloroflexi bacterium]|nr:30S ribosomal protein S20 [Chloroflexota bacterium]